MAQDGIRSPGRALKGEILVPLEERFEALHSAHCTPRPTRFTLRAVLRQLNWSIRVRFNNDLESLLNPAPRADPREEHAAAARLSCSSIERRFEE